MRREEMSKGEGRRWRKGGVEEARREDIGSRGLIQRRRSEAWMSDVGLVVLSLFVLSALLAVVYSSLHRCFYLLSPKSARVPSVLARLQRLGDAAAIKPPPPPT